VDHAEYAALVEGLPHVRLAPKEAGHVELIVCRPAENERKVLTEAELDTSEGLVGDGWRARALAKNGKGDEPDRRSQLTMMNARVAVLVAGSRERWPLAGDQLYVDLNLSAANLPPGTRLAVGEAVIEISDLRHRGCGKFLSRFGIEAQKFVNSEAGRELNLRGVNATIRVGGVVRPGHSIRKVER
jgi:hypothetical protein